RARLRFEPDRSLGRKAKIAQHGQGCRSCSKGIGSRMKQPLLQDEAFIFDVQKARQTSGPDGSEFHLWWLGQSGFLIQWHDKHLLLDPYLSDSLTKKYALTDKAHVRMTERVVAPEKLHFVDVVTSSHNHTDHLD